MSFVREDNDRYGLRTSVYLNYFRGCGCVFLEVNIGVDDAELVEESLRSPAISAPLRAIESDHGEILLP